MKRIDEDDFAFPDEEEPELEGAEDEDGIEAAGEVEEEIDPHELAASAEAVEEDDSPGPDLPAPPVKVLRKALDWAFEKEEGVPSELLERYARHAHMVLERNRRVNLTAILDPKEVAAQHYLDSWRLMQFFSFVGRRVIDLGSGAGFPGIPLAMAEPNASFVLIDSTKKKADFLQEAIEELGIRNAKAHWGRAEDFLARERCDVVLMRAVSSVRENVRTLRRVRHSLKELVMYKGPSWSRELRAGEREADRLGFKFNTVWEHSLPGEMGQRAFLYYRAPGGQGE